jgi:hypothetical protein
MTTKPPLIEKRTAEDFIDAIETGLETASVGWQGETGRPGWAMVRLFTRLTELILNRLNQVPNKYFLAFLNEAGVDRLPPRSARAEVTFLPAKDAPAAIRVPEGTQLATLQTETQPEVVFETVKDLLVVANTLTKCIVFDPLSYGDVTSQATSTASTSSFAAFSGDTPRTRILYLADSRLFTFDDDASREAASVDLKFQLATPGRPAEEGWTLEWRYWDGTTWKALTTQPAEDGTEAQVTDNTNSLSDSGKNVTLAHLPSDLAKTEVNDVEAVWIACCLEGGTGRDHLPVISSLLGSRSFTFQTNNDGVVPATVDAALTNFQASASFTPVDVTGEFYPLGMRPGRLDTFYLQVDEAFTKAGATAALDMSTLRGAADEIDFATGPIPAELQNLKTEWAYYGAQGWRELGTTTIGGVNTVSFKDTTNALTKGGLVTFEIPDARGGASGVSPFTKTKVNDTEGYWIRARVLAGSYNAPAWVDYGGTPQKKESSALSADVSVETPIEIQPETDYVVHEAKTYAPLLGELKVTFSGYIPQDGTPVAIERLASEVDSEVREHTDDLANGTPVSPFAAKEEGPAVYFGFQQAFPSGKWVQILVDVDDEAGNFDDHEKVLWEYSVGGGWSTLRASDGTKGLAERGYLGFFGPEDHEEGSEFGTTAYWLRARHHRAPEAAVAAVSTVLSPDGTTYIATLDASSSMAFGDQTIVKYRWWHAPYADTGVSGDEPLTVFALGRRGVATVALDAGNSKAFNQPSELVSYRWDRLRADDGSGSSEEAESQLRETPYLFGVRLNTVSTENSTTIADEVLGTSDGKPDQVFSTLKTPVLEDAEIAVREPDRPPDEELSVLKKELQAADEDAEAILSTGGATAGQGVWVRWHRVSSFLDSTPASRHFALDPLSGEVRFGDGVQGKIPPVGRDNVKAVRYRTHSGAEGNVDASTITVVRNPSGDLASIKGTTNAEAAAGGTDAETTDRVKLRGPQSLKHRGRAVTYEDFEWLALEASGELVQARCLPVLNADGKPEPGWVTVVITPNSSELKPTPSPSLLRLVERYLEQHALANLLQANHIHVTGPEYIEVTVFAEVVASDPTKADQVELDVLDALKSFLHPLEGGPEAAGWKLGRDVFVSEIYAVIESVSGVDHVAGVRLQSTIRQYDIQFEKDEGSDPATLEYRKLPADVPIDSQVSTFDERIQTLSAVPLLLGASERGASRELRHVVVYDFKVGDKARIVTAGNVTAVDNLSIASISGDTITFNESFLPPGDLSTYALMSADGRLRLPLLEDDGDGTETVSQVTVQGFAAGDAVSIVVGNHRHPDLEFLPIARVAPREDRIFVPEGFLVYSGNHDIDMVLK